METKSSILLDSGTNEVEFLEFILENTSFGINVLKVREIIKPCHVTKLPHSHPNIEGMVELRGEVLPVIHLRRTLGMINDHTGKEDKFIVTEFNGMKVILRVDEVTQIHRLTWEDLEKPESLKHSLDEFVTGVIKVREAMTLLLDVEKILFDIYPGLGLMSQQNEKKVNLDRSAKSIMIAEDSPMLRKLLKETLVSAGYKNVQFFENGTDAWGFLLDAVKGKGEQIDLLITDIEMPQMDGHHLTKKIKEDHSLSIIPVIIFSSLITEHLKHKGESVGADAQISKPQLSMLIDTLDKLLFNQ
ncbi:Chemotaxis protein CheV [Bacillus sp. THAF10]|uniref:chemotaxis protein n=1 Tax=Bacillus sp. THAF10 TaxID=2587848 RepID=UPI001269789B|nr:chemotaxis protein [Bacillus sp. THAF10]QFT88665.1 Chemotaxis protein CheV [Bacillus sp. THAF10]